MVLGVLGGSQVGSGLGWPERSLAPCGLFGWPAQVWSRREAGWRDPKAASGQTSETESGPAAHWHMGDLGEEDSSSSRTNPAAFL